MSRVTIGINADARYRALADGTRRRLLRLLEDAGEPMQVTVLAEAVGLHPNTVRGHLDLLAEAGLVDRFSEERDRPGRPRVLYTPAERVTTGEEGYRFLAEILAGSIKAMSPDPSKVAEEAGRAWGTYLAEKPAPFETFDPIDALERILTTLEDLGFEPEGEMNGTIAEILLHDCPFRDVARNKSDVVCSVHLGLMKGLSEEMGGAIEIESLEPFAEPSLCIAHVKRNRH